MSITINGTGSITGINAGGLPDASIVADDLASNAVTTAKISDANITAAKLSGAQSGSAPIYGARAWVNFDGTSGSIGSGRGNGNVSSVTDNGTGFYTVNLSTAMPDANYAAVGMAGEALTNGGNRYLGVSGWSSSSVNVAITNQSGTRVDEPFASVAIFR